MTCGVYEVRNTVTGCVYIGSSWNVEMRLYEHFVKLRGGYHPNRYLQEAWELDGEAAFCGALLQEVEDVDDAVIDEALERVERKYCRQALGSAGIYNAIMVRRPLRRGNGPAPKAAWRELDLLYPKIDK